MKKQITKKRIYIFFVVIFLLTSNISLGASDDTQQQELKDKIENLRNQISQYQQEISEMSQQEGALLGDVASLEKDIAKIELQIQETELVMESLNLDIVSKQDEINKMQKEVDTQKKILTNFVQELYEKGEATPVEMALGEENFSDYFFQADSIESFEEKTHEVYDRFVFLREGLKREKENLLVKKEEQMQMQMIRKDQERTLEGERKMKNNLITQTRNQKLTLSSQLEKLQEELNALQSLGEPINIDEAVAAARYASRLTDVAPEFLLGMLRIESGLGTNVGGGRYKTDMNPSQWDNFKRICKELKLDAQTVPVSRRACYNTDAKDGCGGWGGAMGPAQFMPSTWLGYKEKVESVTKQMPANPWSLKDSLVAMGLKLGSVDGVTSGDKKAWAKAAGMYLAGGAWENYSWYSDRVLFYTEGFKKILKKI